MNKENAIPRVTGLLIIEARNSNPNGDPDRESDPRTRAHDGKGIISDVSFKRKLRELILNKEGPVWRHLANKLDLDPQYFGIHVDQETRDAAKKAKGEAKKELSENHWDVRVFGSTALEGGDKFIRTGVVQFAVGTSIAKVRICRDTNTIKAGVDTKKDTDRGMAPLGFRVVEHGVYAMPFLINPSAAVHSNCTLKDIELLCHLIPYAYPHTASRIRPMVEIKHAWYFQHKNSLGSCSDFTILDALTPTVADSTIPTQSWEEYALQELDDTLKAKSETFGDLTNEQFVQDLFTAK